ncbi:gustatory receptor for sugar taste 43a-like [Trichogramma pretiosum]|uniref:gustatory receptor for sugar taste 43a-like n=1 Tax=Trichogramma pretiosum TaxID=7493 RepID=UPI000C71B88D|nr:gustatory receptor for sugar taste 43a-like [Trichogramma pretiosum]
MTARRFTAVRSNSDDCTHSAARDPTTNNEYSQIGRYGCLVHQSQRSEADRRWGSRSAKAAAATATAATPWTQEIDDGGDGGNKSDVFHTLAPVYHLSKICGLLPVKFKVNKAGKYEGRLDVAEVVYGIVLVAALAGAQCYGLYRDLRNGWENSTRLSSETAITVTCSDVFAVISAAFVAILGSGYRWHHLQDALNKIVDVDDKLLDVPTSERLRRVSIIVIVASLVYIVVISSLDFVSWRASSAGKNNAHFGDKGPINYAPIYFMYIVVTVFEVQYALVLFNVGERFLKLNKSVANLTKSNMALEQLFRRFTHRHQQQEQSMAFFSNEIGHIGRFRRANNNNKISDFGPGAGIGTEAPSKTAELIGRLIGLHGILCDSVKNINKAYGGAVVVGTISCLIHLIITPYFLYNEIFSDSISSWYVLTMQVFWTFFHVCRLLFLVQPCHMVSVEARKTGTLVSQALASNWQPEAKKQLEIFSLQLLQRPVEFTACGLFFLDRGLVTSIAGAVTTYLVILVQFQNADETKGTKNMLQNATELLKNASSFKNITFKVR